MARKKRSRQKADQKGGDPGTGENRDARQMPGGRKPRSAGETANRPEPPAKPKTGSKRDPLGGREGPTGRGARGDPSGPAQKDSPRGHRTGAIFAAVIAIVLFITYSFSLGNEFVYDDRFLIVDSELVKDLRNIPKTFDVQFYRGLNYYRPLTLMSFILEYRLWGENPFGFHLTNSLLIIAVVLALYCLLYNLFGPERTLLAGLVSLCFGVHPIVSSVVMALGARGDLLSMLFLIVAYICFVRAGPLRHLGAPIFLALALLSKETAVTFPAILLAMDLLVLRPPGKKRMTKDMLASHLPLWSLLGVYLIARSLVLPAFASEITFSPLTTLKSYLYLAQTSLIPSEALAYEPMFRDWFSPWRLVGLGAFLAAAIAFGVLAGRRARRAMAFWLLWAGLAFLPTANIVGQETLYDERYLALPLVGIVTALGLLIYSVRPGGRSYGTAKLVLSVTVVAALCAVTVGRAKYWKDDTSFFAQWQKASPANPRPVNHLGLIFWDMNRVDAAMSFFLQAIELDPRYVLAYNNLGLVHKSQGRMDEAEMYFLRAVAIDPNYAPACFNLGTVLYAKGDFEEALPYFEQALALDPEWAEAYYRAGRACHDTGRPDRAIEYYSRAIELDPALAHAHFGLSSIYEQRGDTAGAIHHLREGLRYSPQDADARARLSRLLGQSESGSRR